MNPEKKLREMAKALDGFEELIMEEVTMKEQIKSFLEKHSTSELMEVVARAIYEKESET